MSKLGCYLWGHKGGEVVGIVSVEIISGGLPEGVDHKVVYRLRKANDQEIRDGKAYWLKCSDCRQLLIHI